MKKKVKVATQSNVIDLEEEQAIIQYADVAVEALKEEKPGDPFDIYAQQVRSKVHANSGEFHNKLLRGYTVLLEKLRDQSIDKTVKENL